MISGSVDENIVQDIDRLMKEAQVQRGKVQEKQALYYNMRRRVLEINVGDFALL